MRICDDGPFNKLHFYNSVKDWILDERPWLHSRQAGMFLSATNPRPYVGPVESTQGQFYWG